MTTNDGHVFFFWQLFDCLVYEMLNRVFSYDVTAAMLVSETKPLGIELYFYANILSFVSVNQYGRYSRE